MTRATTYETPRPAGRPGETVVTSTCGHNCGGRCVVNAHVVDDRIVRISTDPRRWSPELPPLHACVRGFGAAERVHHPDRLTHPLRRVGPRGAGQWERISWDVALDTVATAIVSLASIAERRLYRLLDEHQSNGLPPFLVHGSGLNSGFMLVQYTAASLVSECKVLAHPASVDSIPSSAGQEDHVSMGMTAARHAREVVANAETVVALEALGAAQALDLRAPLEPGPATRAVHRAIRAAVPFFDADREFGPDIADALSLVRQGELVAAAETATGPLD